MGIPDRQTSYWDSVAGRKTFTHPLWLGPLLAETPLDARILDYGCGYGRTCIELSQAGFRDVTGIDISREMIARGRREHPGIDLRVFDGLAIPFADNSFQTCTLLAVLTCIPSDAEQERVVAEIHRVLRPGGLLHVSDYPIQDDKRNRDRYRQFAPVFGTYGIFRIDEGAVVRHHDGACLRDLFRNFEFTMDRRLQVKTMNGNETEIFQLVLRKG